MFAGLTRFVRLQLTQNSAAGLLTRTRKGMEGTLVKSWQPVMICCIMLELLSSQMYNGTILVARRRLGLLNDGRPC